MTKSQAKEVIDMMFKDKTDIPKEDVFKIIDMIDEPITYQPITCPSCPSYPSISWGDRLVYCGGNTPKVTLNN